METIEPWGEHRADLRAARICQCILGAAGCKLSFEEIVKMFDFGPKRQQSEEEAEAALDVAARRAK